MADSSRCIAALNKAAGKELSADELQTVFESIQRVARDIAAGRIKPEGEANLSSPEGIMQKAAEIAAKELIGEKVRQQRNTHLRVAILGERKAEVQAMKEGGISGVDAVRRLIANDSDGNVRDELTRSFWQFKAFPIAQFQRIWEIGLSRPTTGGKAQFLSSILLMQTMAGAMMLQTQSLLSGQDPKSMDDWKFWLAAFIKGGSLGIYGDFLYSQSATTRYGSGPLEALAGPTIGSAATGVTALVQAGNAMKEGRDTHLGAQLLNLSKGFIPAQNLWYTRAATDHIIFQNAQEVLSPGYLANMRARSVRDFGQDWWWAPGEFLPDRVPDWANALGQ